ncbi:MAG: hypothetical protein U1E65_30120 [Myxococcota bacterium]
MTNALGPTLAGGMQPIVEDGYELLYLPDVDNDALQREGKPPVFYWLPNAVRIARKNQNEDGDFLFNLIRFAGVEDVGNKNNMVAGGVLTFTATMAPPDHVLKTSQEKIIKQWTAQPDYFWGIRTAQPPVFRPAIITSNITTISNVSPTANKLIPAFVRPTKGGPGGFKLFGSVPPPVLPAVVREGSTNGSTLDPWYWQMQGQGSGSIDASGQNAYSALVGAYPTAILWEAFHGVSSPIVVIQALKLKVWSPVVELSIRGDWDTIFEHFSAAAHAHYLWASADIAAEINNMRAKGKLTVDLKVDQTLPGADKIAEQIEKRSDLIIQKFTELAQKRIFEPPAPKVEAAQASNPPGPWGLGLALKYRRDSNSISLEYNETRQFAYLQEHTVSSSMEGMYNEIKKDPAAEKKYFLSVFLEDWPRNLVRIVKPIVNWRSQPVAFLSAAVGYPDKEGAILWDGTTFQKTDAEGTSWKIGITQKSKADVKNPPAGWEPDRTFVKRKVHMLESTGIFDDPNVRIEIDQNVLDLDPEPNGTLMNDSSIEVRADDACPIAVGPISLGVLLDDPRQTVEVTFDPTDAGGTSLQRDPTRFQWKMADLDTPRYWQIFTADPKVRSFYRYQVKVTIKGSLTSKGQTWTGPWVNTSAKGPLVVEVPMADDPNVVSRGIVDVMVVSSKGEVTRAGEAPAATPRKDAPTPSLSLRGWSMDAPARDEPPAKSKEGNGEMPRLSDLARVPFHS